MQAQPHVESTACLCPSKGEHQSFFFFPLKLCPVFYFLIRFLRRKMNTMTWELSLQCSVYTTKSKEDLDGN